MARCPEVHSAKETKPGGWTRRVDCPCDLAEGHDDSHYCGKHGTKFAVLRRMTVSTTTPKEQPGS